MPCCVSRRIVKNIIITVGYKNVTVVLSARAVNNKAAENETESARAAMEAFEENVKIVAAVKIATVEQHVESHQSAL